MTKVEIFYADGYSEIVAVDAPNQQDAMKLAQKHAMRPTIHGGRGIKVTGVKFVGTFEPTQDEHLRDLGGRW